MIIDISEFYEAVGKQLERFIDMQRAREELDKAREELKRILREIRREARLKEPRRERAPLPPYREKLHPRKDYQHKAYWLRTRSNPTRRNYH